MKRIHWSHDDGSFTEELVDDSATLAKGDVEEYVVEQPHTKQVIKVEDVAVEEEPEPTPEPQPVDEHGDLIPTPVVISDEPTPEPAPPVTADISGGGNVVTGE